MDERAEFLAAAAAADRAAVRCRPRHVRLALSGRGQGGRIKAWKS
jgi:hypothetical protein